MKKFKNKNIKDKQGDFMFQRVGNEHIHSSEKVAMELSML